MRKPLDVAAFHADYDKHKDHRIHLFAEVAALLTPRRVLYPGSYVDIAPSVFFDDVHYVDVDKRARRFFANDEAVTALIAAKRKQVGRSATSMAFRFTQGDYQERLDVADGSIDLLISLYAGFISAHCSRYVAPGGSFFVNNSHGDASMVSLDSDFALTAVVNSRDGGYHLSTKNLDTYMIPKRGEPPTVSGLQASGRGIGYTKSPYAYLFQRKA